MSVRFRYRAATPDGQVVEGVVQAPSRQSVLEDLRRQRLYPVTVDEATSAAGAHLGRRLGRRASRDELERVARQEGMGSLWDDGLAKVAEGLTSVDELARVCG